MKTIVLNLWVGVGAVLFFLILLAIFFMEVIGASRSSWFALCVFGEASMGFWERIEERLKKWKNS